MIYVFGWLVLSYLCCFHLFCSGADMKFRMHSARIEDGFWKFHRDWYAEGFKLLTHDYFGVYCPWSWETAKQNRLADMRVYLGKDGRSHEVLGHITSVDCDDPAKQEAIARHSFISRRKHWIRGLSTCVFSPVWVPILIVLAIIIGVVEIAMSA